MLDRPDNIKHRLISEEAADWLVRLREGRASDRLEYVRWLKRSPAHVREMLELASLEGLLKNADLTGLPPPGGHFGTSESLASVVELNPTHKREEAPLQTQRSPWQHWKLAVSACISRIESRIGFAGRALSKFVGIRG